jgi:hypothetical protein
MQINDLRSVQKLQSHLILRDAVKINAQHVGRHAIIPVPPSDETVPLLAYGQLKVVILQHPRQTERITFLDPLFRHVINAAPVALPPASHTC